MWLQQKLNPTPTDKTQAMIFTWMPWIFMFMLGSFASGLVIYWVANNTITFVQQYTIMRHQGVKPEVLSNILAPLKRSARPAECSPRRHLWRHPIKAHGVEPVPEVTLEPRRDHALGPGLGDRPRRRQGHAGQRRLGACANFSRGAKSPALMAIRAGVDEAAGRVTLTHPRRSPSASIPTTPPTPPG